MSLFTLNPAELHGIHIYILSDVNCFSMPSRKTVEFTLIAVIHGDCLPQNDDLPLHRLGCHISLSRASSKHNHISCCDSPTESPSCDDVVCGLDQACHMVADGCTMCTSPQCLYSVCSTECYNCATNDSCVLMTGWCPRVPWWVNKLRVLLYLCRNRKR
ncbi:hypothetical protein ANCCAN_10855 [Ancylostoma caninum]|uniref:Uncharacterized protein n=1 Tax=Ancylostoma caninum TaxID=29170 RepID=A0A368GHK6_ANCCA|nr:hypothetical protein ANCCAN_10855 [Ancylostoma caninum]